MRLEARDADLISKIDTVIADLEPPKFFDETDLIQKIYRIPTTSESFADGGNEILIDLFNELESLFGENPPALSIREMKKFFPN